MILEFSVIVHDITSESPTTSLHIQTYWMVTNTNSLVELETIVVDSLGG